MGADYMKIQQSVVGREYEAQRQSITAFIETLPQGANADPSMGVRISKIISDPLDQFPDILAFLPGTRPQNSQ